MTRQPHLCALAVVLHEGHALLAQRGKEPDRGLWGFPGGHVEWGETVLEAAARELIEETGVVAEPVDYLTNIDLLRFGDDGAASAHFLLAAVRCAYISGIPAPSDDVNDARWVPFRDIENGRLPLSERVGELLTLARQTG